MASITATTLFTLLTLGIASAQSPSGGVIRGQVEDPAKENITGASVRLVNGELSRETKTGARGEYSFEGLPEGDYRVLISMSGFNVKVLRATLAQGEMWNLRRAQLQAMETGFVTEQPAIHFLAEGTSTGNLIAHIVGESSAAVSGAHIELNCAKGAKCRTQTTNAAGDVRFTNLPEGQYSVKISARGFYERTLSIEVPSGVEFDYPSVSLERCAESTCSAKKRSEASALE